nr:MAG TPA: hypothetical protein [Caudoviricetes sp.]
MFFKKSHPGNFSLYKNIIVCCHLRTENISRLI